MVVLHHAVLAYYVKGPLPSKGLPLAPRWWQAFPVVDSAKWSGFTPFVLFNDSYTMGVLFFLSGLFSWGSLRRKGALSYLHDRLIRLGLPLIFMAVLGPATYYAAYLQGRLHDGFWHEWLSLKSWPSGPAWFLEALLFFDAFAILIYIFTPRTLERTGRWVATIRRPSSIILLVTVSSAALFMPALLRFGFYGAGVLFYPITRVVHNLVYFLVGLALGSATFADSKTEDTLLSAGGRLAKEWLPLSLSAAVAFALWQGIHHLSNAHYGSMLWTVMTGMGFCLSSAVSTFAVLAFFLRFAQRPSPMWEHLLACSFGIYLVHYVVVAWIQYAFLSFAAPGLFKGLVVFFVALTISWTIVAFVRRFNLVARVV